MAAKQDQSKSTKELSGGNQAVDLTKTTGSATQQLPPTDGNAPPTSSTANLTTARRMVTRGRGKLQQDQEESSNSNKRKLPSGSNCPTPKHGTSPKKGMTSPVVKVTKLPTSGSETITLDTPKKRVSPQKSVDTNQVIPKVTVQPRTKTSVMKVKMESVSRAIDIRVRHTPSESLPGHISHKPLKHSFYSTREMEELKKRALKAEKAVTRLKKDQRRLRMQVYRANKKNDRVMEDILKEENEHEEIEQQLKAIMLGVQLELVTADPEAT